MGKIPLLHGGNRGSIPLASTIIASIIIGTGIVYYLVSPKSNEDSTFKSRECTHSGAITEFGLCENCGTPLGL